MFHIVEDSEILREMLVDMIDSLGRTGVPFASPLEYLEYLQSDDFTVPCAVLTDVNMPHMSGYEMIESILSMNPSIKFAVMSGEPNICSQYKDKVCMFLEKPYTGQQVEELVNKFKRCESSGPSPNIGCAQFGSRRSFTLSSTICPKATCN